MRAVLQRVKRANVSVQRNVIIPPNESEYHEHQNLIDQNSPNPSNPKEMKELTHSDVDPQGEDEHALVAHNHPQMTDDSHKTIVPINSSHLVREVLGEIGYGLVALIGIGRDDSDADVAYLVDRTLNLRIFSDKNDQMNFSLLDVAGEVLVVSQFTLYGDTRKGRRPSFFDAMDPVEASGFYLSYCKQLQDKGVRVQTGQFGANMEVSLVNDGPVTILIDSKKGF